MPFGPVIQVENEAQVRKAFRALVGSGKDLTKANRQVAKVTLSLSRSAASGDSERGSAVGALAAAATQSAAALTISSAKVPWALGAFMGAKQYPQFDQWIGSNWDLAEGTGPYAIRDAFNASGIERIKATYEKEIGDTLRAAGIPVQH